MNGFPGGPPPRLALSLGDSLAGMFAVQGALAALYRRTVSRRGPGRRRRADRGVPGHPGVHHSRLRRRRASCAGRREPGWKALRRRTSTAPPTAAGWSSRPTRTPCSGGCARPWTTRAGHRRPVRRSRCPRPQPGRAATRSSVTGPPASARRHHRNPQRRRGDQRTDQHRRRSGARSAIAGPRHARRALRRRIGRNVLGPGVIPVLSETPGSVRNAGPARPGPAQRRGLRRPAGADRRRDRRPASSRGCCERSSRTRDDPRGGPARRPADRDTRSRCPPSSNCWPPSRPPGCARSRRRRSSRRRRCRHWPTRPTSPPQLSDYPDIEFSALVASPNGAKRAIAAGPALDGVRGLGGRRAQPCQRRPQQRRGHRADRRDRRDRARLRRQRRGHHRHRMGLPVRRTHRRRSGSSTSSTRQSSTGPTGSRSPTPSAPPRPGGSPRWCARCAHASASCRWARISTTPAARDWPVPMPR